MSDTLKGLFRKIKEKCWKEIYITMDMGKFSTARNLLEGQSINYKTDISGDSMRSAMSMPARESMISGRTGENRTVYKIYVRERDKDRGIQILNKSSSL